MGNAGFVSMVVSTERHRELELAKLDAVSREKLVKSALAWRARNLFTVVEVLISQVGKEKAKELIDEAQYSIFYKRGKEAAEKAGNPKDIEGYIKENTLNLLDHVPSAPIPEIVERTKNRYVFKCTKCYQAESLLEFAAGESVGMVKGEYCLEDKEALEVVKYCCPHDKGWANGFNPDMKFERVKFFSGWG